MYIKNTDNTIQDGLVQIWKHELLLSSTVSTNKIIDYVQKKVINSLDLKIVNFLYQFDIASKDIIAKHLGYELPDNLDKNLNKLLECRIINCFALCDDSEVKIKDDAKLFYTLDAPALTLIDLYTNEDDALNYKLGDLIMTSTKVNRRMMAGEFYVKLKATLGHRLKWYKRRPLLACAGKKYRPDAMFTINSDSGKKAYILEVVRMEDFYEEGSTRFVQQLSRCDSIINTQAWKKYLSDTATAPSLLIFTDTEQAAKKCADLAETAGLISGYRLTYSERFKSTDLKNAFYKYEDGKLKTVLLKNFKKTEE